MIGNNPIVPAGSPIPALTGIFDAGIDIANLVMQGKQNEWQREMVAESWRREDNAAQRRAADLKAAGLSKTLAAGSPAQSSQAPVLNAPQMKSALTERAIALKRMRADTARTQAETDRINVLKKEDKRNFKIAEDAGVRSDVKNSVATQITESINALAAAFQERGAGNTVRDALAPVVSKTKEAVDTQVEQHLERAGERREVVNDAITEALEEGDIPLARAYGEWAAKKWNDSAFGQRINQWNENRRNRNE